MHRGQPYARLFDSFFYKHYVNICYMFHEAAVCLTMCLSTTLVLPSTVILSSPVGTHDGFKRTSALNTVLC